MRKILLPSLYASLLVAGPITIETVTVSAESETKPAALSAEEIKFTRQSDLGEILSQTIPSIQAVRASAVGTDITVRGFKRDDVTVTIDDAKVCGACPNRMDPPAMHVSSAQIERVEVQEGPFNVRHSGSMGGSVEIDTKKPKPGLEAELSATVGSFGYQKYGVTVNGGNQKLRAIAGYSYETSDQYEDGDGKTMSQQVGERIASDSKDSYTDSDKDRDAYTRQNFWAKAIAMIGENHEIMASYYGDRARDVLYPVFAMDAQIDDTDMYALSYRGLNLNSLSRELLVKYYYSTVDHEMGTDFRKSGDYSTTFRTHAVTSTIQGLRAENRMTLASFDLLAGVDSSLRNWDGTCLSEPTNEPRQTRIPDVDTTNLAFYVEAKSLASQGLGWEAGARVERTSIKPNRALADATGYSMQAQAVKNFIRALPDRDFTNLTGNLLLRYRLGQGSAWVGVGHGVRVPDAKEYGFINYMNNNWMLKGNPYLNETKNNEIDLGVEHQTEQWGVKVTAFYSDLTDYIYAYKSGMTTTFANIDAHIYGGEVAANLVMFDGRVNLEGSLAYQRGKKDSQPIASQNDEDLAEMTPLRGRVALTYDDSTLYGRIEWLGATSQEDIDEANGEKKIAGYGIINLKAGYTIGKHWALNGGINNLLDQTYALNNSYVGRGVISASGNNVLVLNEPGRALYANLTYRY